MPQFVQDRFQWTLSSNGNVSITGPGTLGGIFVSAASSTPTLTVQDAASAQAANGNAIVHTFTPSAATWYAMPFGFSSGLQVISGGAVSYTVAWNK